MDDLTTERFLFDRMVSSDAKNRAFKGWLQNMERSGVEVLRRETFGVSRYENDLTVIIYDFGDRREDEWSFQPEFSILHTWRLLGRLKTVIVTDKKRNRYAELCSRYPNAVAVRISETLGKGGFAALNEDSIVNLHRYFKTPYCLTIQDDGIPLQGDVGRFLGCWDFIGAPNVGFGFCRHLADLVLKDGLNGGFSIRSRKYCKTVSDNWCKWMCAYSRAFGVQSEDLLYSCTVRMNPLVRLRSRIPFADEARRFSFYDLVGTWSRKVLKHQPFGIHGRTTIWQYRDVMREFGYDVDSVPIRIEA